MRSLHFSVAFQVKYRSFGHVPSGGRSAKCYNRDKQLSYQVNLHPRCLQVCHTIRTFQIRLLAMSPTRGLRQSKRYVGSKFILMCNSEARLLMTANR